MPEISFTIVKLISAIQPELIFVLFSQTFTDGFTPTSVVTVHPINKQEWHDQYVQDRQTYSESASIEEDNDSNEIRYPTGNRSWMKNPIPPLEALSDTFENASAEQLKDEHAIAWGNYDITPDLIHFPEPCVDDIMEHESDVVYEVVDGVHRWISWTLFSAIGREGTGSDFLSARVLPVGVNHRVQEMIGSYINSTNMASCRMNIAAICVLLGRYKNQGFTHVEMRKFLPSSVSHSTIGQYVSITNKLVEYKLLNRFQHLCDTLPTGSDYVYPFNRDFMATKMFAKSVVKKDDQTDEVYSLFFDEVEKLAKARMLYMDKFENELKVAKDQGSKRKGTKKVTKKKQPPMKQAALIEMLKKLPNRVKQKKLLEDTKLHELHKLESLYVDGGDNSRLPDKAQQLEKIDNVGKSLEQKLRSGKFDNIADVEVTRSLFQQQFDPIIQRSGKLTPKKKKVVVEDTYTDEKTLADGGTVEFRTGNMLLHFSEAFKKWAGVSGVKAQLCLTDPPWGILKANEHEHDSQWKDRDWRKFASQITSTMEDDGVILVFVPWEHMHSLKEMFAVFDWKAWPHPYLWTWPLHPFKYTHIPANLLAAYHGVHEDYG